MSTDKTADVCASLRRVDHLVQGHCDEIATLCAAAIRGLAIDPHSLADVCVLLDLARDRAQCLTDAVDNEASEQGCSSADDPEFGCARPARRALYAQWHGGGASATGATMAGGVR